MEKMVEIENNRENNEDKKTKKGLKSEFVFCPRCREFKKRYVDNVDFCQVCYRKILDEYSYYDYAVDKRRLSGNAKKICELLIDEGYNRKEIHKILGLNQAYVSQIINKYAVRVNAKGEKKPF